jgi:hypothetical protein
VVPCHFPGRTGIDGIGSRFITQCHVATTMSSQERLGRRRYLAVVGTATTGLVAGCSGLTEQSFESQAVGLDDAAREDLQLAETERSSPTTSRTGPSGNVEVSVTNHVTVYRRADAQEGE